MFLERAIASIRAQSANRDVSIEVLICVDRGQTVPELSNMAGVRVVEAGDRGQAAAMNAGAERVDADYLAFLEDDDQWHPDRVAYAMQALSKADFTSSTQLEVDQGGIVLRINDFPTPSGWLMPMSTWRRIGPFDPSYRWHLDNEWLGRLGESALRRVHLVEATAPVHPSMVAQVRPWLQNCLVLGGPGVSLARHPLLAPLVTRMAHSNSGMATIARDGAAATVSDAEMQRLAARFGRLPW